MGATNPKEAKEGTIRKNLLFQLIKIQFTDQTLRKMPQKKYLFF